MKKWTSKWEQVSGGYLISWTRDPDGRIVRMENYNGDPVEPMYDARGHRTTLSYASGHIQEYAYDADGRNVGIRDTVGSEVQRFTYTFDSNGNRTGTQDLNGSNSVYEYDAADRLIKDTTTGTGAHLYTYTWDSRTNLLDIKENHVSESMKFNAASQVILRSDSAGTHLPVYDANGNLKQVGTTTLTYDKENRLISIPDPDLSGALVTLTYDAFGYLREENFDGDINEVYWLGDNYLGERSDPTPTGQLTNLYLSLDGMIMGETLDPFGTNVWMDYLVDFLGSVTGQVDGGGTASNFRRYKPLGPLLSGASVPRQGYGYTGNTGSRHLGILLAEQYNRRRIFTTWFKQWITRDPLWPEELAYGYVNGNPTTWVDPRGLACTPLTPTKNECAMSGSTGACIALVCSLASSRDFMNFFSKLTSLVNKLDDFLDEKRRKQLREFLKSLKSAAGQTDPFTATQECCKKARGYLKTSPEKFTKDQWQHGIPESELIPFLISWICRSENLMGKALPGAVCRASSTDQSECLACCDELIPGTSSEDERRKNACQKACYTMPDPYR